MRLNAFIARAGVASRRAADDLIAAGQVKVNGQIVTELGVKIDPETDEVVVKGQSVSLAPEVVTYLLNKPRGVVTTASDPTGKRTVVELVPNSPRVFPCGRLDEDTMGLVLLTNDGNLCYQLTHPKFEHQKEYVVHGHAKDPSAAIAKIQAGVTLKDGHIKPDAISDVRFHHQKVTFTITIHEGRNRLVRRMCAKVGIEIDSLTRIRLGKYTLGSLKLGEWRRV